jgi:hypothetical protein
MIKKIVSLLATCAVVVALVPGPAILMAFGGSGGTQSPPCTLAVAGSPCLSLPAAFPETGTVCPASGNNGKCVGGSNPLLCECRTKPSGQGPGDRHCICSDKQ